MNLNSSKPPSRFRSGGLTRSLVTAAVLAGPAVMTAQAEIIYSGGQNRSSGSINIDNAGEAEFSLVSSSTVSKAGTFYTHSLSIAAASSFDFGATTVQLPGGSTAMNLSLLGASSSIGAGRTFSLLSTAPIAATGSLSGWPGGTGGYFGFRFNPSGSQVLYGWGYLRLSSGLSSMTLVDWAYEDSGAAIVVGAPEIVVEQPVGIIQ